MPYDTVTDTRLGQSTQTKKRQKRLGRPKLTDDTFGWFLAARVTQETHDKFRDIIDMDNTTVGRVAGQLITEYVREHYPRVAEEMKNETVMAATGATET